MPLSRLNLQQPAKRELLGGDLLAQSLKHLGTEVAFGIHGGHLDAFLVGAEEIGVRLIDTRHETVAVQAAEGYAKVSGKVGVCFVTANSGFCNGFPGLASAFADRSPIFCITSSPPLQDAETNALQGFHDQVVVAKPVTKFAHRITNAEEIPRIVSYAFRAANSGIKGPVLLDFPIDVLFTPPHTPRIAYGSLSAPPAYAPAPDPVAIEELARAWSSAKRPVIITGTGARGTKGVLQKLAEATSTPVFYSNKYSSEIPHGHELRAGPATVLPVLPASGRPQPDFVLLLGARTGFLLAGRSGAIIPKDCVLAQVDVDGSEIGKVLPIEIGITADASLFAEAFVAKNSSINFTRSDDWIKTCASLQSATESFKSDPKHNGNGEIHPWHGMHALMTSLPPDAIISLDGGDVGQWASMNLEHAKPYLSINSTGYLGFLGNGWGYSIGAAIADPDRLIVNIQGDGSAGFHIQELDTMARFNLNILTVIQNNSVWGMSINGQDIVYAKTSTSRPVTTLSKSCAYEVVAQGFSCNGVKVTEYEKIAGAVKDLTGKGKGPGLINLCVSVKPASPATIAMVGMVEDDSVIVVPYYDNVARPFYKDGGCVNGKAH